MHRVLRLQRPVHLVRIHVVLAEGNAVSAVLRVLPEQICRLIDVIHRLRLQIRQAQNTPPPSRAMVSRKPKNRLICPLLRV